MSVMVVVLLGGLWALILLPGAWRDLRYVSPLNSVEAFEQSMSRLAPPRTPPGGHVVVLGRPGQKLSPPAFPPPVTPPRPAPTHSQALTPAMRRPSPQTLQRRRQVLAALAGATGVTGALGLLAGGIAWLAFVLAYAALFGYIALLAQIRARRDEARAKLHYLAPTPAVRSLSSGVRVRTARGA